MRQDFQSRLIFHILGSGLLTAFRSFFQPHGTLHISQSLMLYAALAAPKGVGSKTTEVDLPARNGAGTLLRKQKNHASLYLQMYTYVC